MTYYMIRWGGAMRGPSKRAANAMDEFDYSFGRANCEHALVLDMGTRLDKVRQATYRQQRMGDPANWQLMPAELLRGHDRVAREARLHARTQCACGAPGVVFVYSAWYCAEHGKVMGASPEHIADCQVYPALMPPRPA